MLSANRRARTLSCVPGLGLTAARLLALACFSLANVAILWAAPGMAHASSAGVQLPAGAVAWYPAEGNANDPAGGHNGVLHNGVSFGPGVVGQAFVFDGIDDYVSVADEETFDFGAGPSPYPSGPRPRVAEASTSTYFQREICGLEAMTTGWAWVAAQTGESGCNTSGMDQVTWRAPPG